MRQARGHCDRARSVTAPLGVEHSTPRVEVIVAALLLAASKQAALQPGFLRQVGSNYFQQLIFFLICQAVLSLARSGSGFQLMSSEKNDHSPPIKEKSAAARLGFRVTAHYGNFA